MQIRSIVLARCVQRAKSLTGAIGYLPDVIQKVKTRYGFLVVPRDEDLVPSDPPKAGVFQHGRLSMGGRLIIIDRFTVFNDGIAADSSASTDELDLFLDDLISWAKDEFPKIELVGPRYYLSQMEVQLNTPLENYAPQFIPIGERLTSLLSSYGIEVPRYEVTAIQLNFDQVGKLPPQPGIFFIDRRLNVPYGDNVWFAQAPLKTEDHKALLRELD